MKYFCLAWVTSYKASFFNIQIYTYTVYVCVQILRYDYTYTIVSKFRYIYRYLSLHDNVERVVASYLYIYTKNI